MGIFSRLNRRATPRESLAVFGALIFVGSAGCTILNAVGNRDAIAVDRLTMEQRAARTLPGDSGVYAIAAGQLQYLEMQETNRWELSGYATVGTLIAAGGLGLVLLSRRRPG